MASLVAAFHFVAQAGLYAVGFAVGPGGVERKVLGVSIHGMASVVTFPLVPLVERLGGSGVGLVVLPLNSAVWGACAFVVIRAVRGLTAHGRG